MYVGIKISDSTGFSDTTTISSTLSEKQVIQARSGSKRKKLSIASYFMAGTFGIAAITMGTSPGNIPVRTSILSTDKNKNSITHSGVIATDINYVRSKGNLSVSEIAKTLQVSRQAVHDWMKNGSISDRNLEKLSKLIQVIEIFDNSGTQVSPYQMRRQINGGKSVLARLASGEDASEAAFSLIRSINTEKLQKERASHRSNRNSQMTNSASNASTPSQVVDA